MLVQAAHPKHLRNTIEKQSLWHQRCRKEPRQIVLRAARRWFFKSPSWGAMPVRNFGDAVLSLSAAVSQNVMHDDVLHMTSACCARSPQPSEGGGGSVCSVEYLDRDHLSLNPNGAHYKPTSAPS